MYTIMVVEDERRLREIIVKYFIAEGFKVLEAENGRAAIELVKMESVDVILMDVMMPELNGFEACKQIRTFSDALVIMLTARDDDEDKIKGFDCGADEYVTKPFSPKVLVARVNALLKRLGNKTEAQDYIQISGLKIYKENYEVYDMGKEVKLSPKEYDLLLLLVENRNAVLTRETILNKVWGYDYYGDYRTVDTHIKKLRKKLPHSSDAIKTIVKLGYKFEVK
ncbi:response regulator transcription factor [Fusibacter sp. 3D3]|uniref:response regulator transcription factor n=1 Tax=Fusibacter sp. 3D3 TaxID=1048380 RepID=UPI0008539505|nr:response regulator transcription factor [Fusibacter sp. 3D3]GAU76360.1 two-component response regulator [Fusibacter sp. 3D3]